MRALVALLCSLSICGADTIINSYRFAAAAINLTNGLVAYWNLDEASGDRAASVGFTLTDNGTVAGTAAIISNGADFELSNSGEVLSASDATAAVVDFSGAQSFTIACWVKWEGHTANNNIVAKQLTTGGQRSYTLGYAVGVDRIQFAVSWDGSSTNTTALNADTLGSPSNATWYFVVAWHDADADTLSIQVGTGSTLGAVDSSAHNSTGVYGATAEFLIGARTTGAAPGDRLDGIVDEVGIWNRVLTSGERTALFNGGSGVTYPF